MAITFHLLTGSSVSECLDDLASLRINIFRGYPYLYDGILDDELKYLRLYMETADAFVISVRNADTMIGAATGMPLKLEHESLTYPFASTLYSVDETYYVGEVLFYQNYQNQGLGLRLLEQVEEHVRSLGSYRYLTCASVLRPVDHPLIPENYLPIERFLDRTRFRMLSGVTTSFDWKETGGISRSHSMQFWIKDL